MCVMDQPTWRNVCSAFGEAKNSQNLSLLNVNWQTFCGLILNYDGGHPYHLQALIEELERCRGSTRSREEIVILDHGSGGAGTLFYLAALGYTNFYGVDIEDRDYDRLNWIAFHLLGAREKRFIVYDGLTLPLANETIDLVFSQQVLEHVSPKQFNSFFTEEFRVLKHGGTMLHEIPHRLGPYDSHTRTWLLHWLLPPTLWLHTLRLVGRDPQVYIFLRWPWVHRRLAKRCFGNVEVQTVRRLRKLSNIPYYDGPVNLRRLMAWLMKVPIAGMLISYVLAPFAMLSIRSTKILH